MSFISPFDDFFDGQQQSWHTLPSGGSGEAMLSGNLAYTESTPSENLIGGDGMSYSQFASHSSLEFVSSTISSLTSDISLIPSHSATLSPVKTFCARVISNGEVAVGVGTTVSSSTEHVPMHSRRVITTQNAIGPHELPHGVRRSLFTSLATVTNSSGEPVCLAPSTSAMSSASCSSSSSESSLTSGPSSIAGTSSPHSSSSYAPVTMTPRLTGDYLTNSGSISRTSAAPLSMPGTSSIHSRSVTFSPHYSLLGHQASSDASVARLSMPGTSSTHSRSEAFRSHSSSGDELSSASVTPSPTRKTSSIHSESVTSSSPHSLLSGTISSDVTATPSPMEGTSSTRAVSEVYSSPSPIMNGDLTPLPIAEYHPNRSHSAMSISFPRSNPLAQSPRSVSTTPLYLSHLVNKTFAQPKKKRGRPAKDRPNPLVPISDGAASSSISATPLHITESFSNRAGSRSRTPSTMDFSPLTPLLGSPMPMSTSPAIGSSPSIVVAASLPISATPSSIKRSSSNRSSSTRTSRSRDSSPLTTPSRSLMPMSTSPAIDSSPSIVVAASSPISATPSSITGSSSNRSHSTRTPGTGDSSPLTPLSGSPIPMSASPAVGSSPSPSDFSLERTKYPDDKSYIQFLEEELLRSRSVNHQLIDFNTQLQEKAGKLESVSAQLQLSELNREQQKRQIGSQNEASDKLLKQIMTLHEKLRKYEAMPKETFCPTLLQKANALELLLGSSSELRFIECRSLIFELIRFIQNRR